MTLLLNRYSGRVRLLLIVALGALVIAGCSSGGGSKGPSVSSVDILPDNVPAELPPNATYQLSAAANLSNGSVEDVSSSAQWQSSDTAIVEVTNTGLITAKAEGGPVEITAAFGGKTSSPVSITVKAGTTPPVQPPVTTLSVALDPATAQGGLPINESFQVQATATQSDGTKKSVTSTATWESSDPTTVSVTSSGVIKGEKAGGPVAITATSGGRKSAPLNVTVDGTAEFKLVKLEISPFSTAELPAGERRTHTAIGLWSDGIKTQTYEISEESGWASANEAVVSIPEPSVALGVDRGNTTISANYGSPVIQSNTLPIYVGAKTPPPGPGPGPEPTPDSLVIAPVPLADDKLLTGFVYQADAYLVSNTGNQTVKVTESSDWSSDKPDILKVLNDPGARGQTQALAAGTATLSVTRDGKTVTQAYTVAAEEVQIKNAKIILAGGSNGYPVGLDIALRVVADVDAGDGAGFKSQDITQYLLYNVKESKIASVTNEGFPIYLTGSNAGTTSVQAWLANVGVPIASASVNFQNAVVSAISLEPGVPQPLPVGLSTQFKATGFFNGLDASQNSFDISRQVTFRSSNTAVADISNASGTKGVLTAVAIGTTAVTAEFDTIRSRALNQEVKGATLQTLSIEPASSTIALKAGTLQFKAVGFYSDNSEVDETQRADWISGNTDAVKFNPRSFGKGRAVLYQEASEPSVLITAVISGEAQPAQTFLTVNNPTSVTNLTLTAGATSVKQGESLQLTTQADFSDGLQHDVTLATDWFVEGDSPNAKVAGGVVTGVSEGKATVVARFEGLEQKTEITVTAQ